MGPAFLGFVAVAFVGIAFLIFTRNSDDYEKVDIPEMFLGIVVCGLIIFGVTHFGDKAGVESKINGYHQFLNGSVISAEMSTTPCTRDGSCQHSYNCDPYVVMVTHYRTVSDGVDSKGNPQSHTESYEEPETRYHDCPYATVEYSYWTVVSFNFKTKTVGIASHIFAANPQQWRSGEGIPGDVQRGIPQAWQQASDAIAAGNLLPATGTDDYTNFILATKDTLLKQYSPDIAKYQRQGLLPPHTANWKSGPIYGGWSAQKFQVVGGLKTNVGLWNDNLMRINAALGVMRQGDMHIVAVPASKVSNPEAYLLALKAYWQGPAFGKWAVAKNSVILAVGVSNDGRTVEWVKGQTGMPTGNGTMEAALEAIRNVPFNPSSFLGKPRAIIDSGKLNYTSTGGLVENITIFDPTTQFARACMKKCSDKGDHGTSYVYLKGEVIVSSGVHWTEFFVSLVLSIAVWVGLYFFPLVSSFLEAFGYGGKSDSTDYPPRRYRDTY